MDVTPTTLPEVLLITPRRYTDVRGYFMETWSATRYAEVGIAGPIVQDNVSWSHRGVLRGLHFQNPVGQAKLVYVLSGEIFDVAVDIRRGSPQFGQWCGVHLSAANGRQLSIPAGFAHGFCVISESALVAYKCTAPYTPTAERGIVWDDPSLEITWPIDRPIVSTKDAALSGLRSIDPDDLPTYYPCRDEESRFAFDASPMHPRNTQLSTGA